MEDPRHAEQTLPHPVPVPQPERASAPESFRLITGSVVGRLVILAGFAGGMFGFPVLAFLSVVATDELGVRFAGGFPCSLRPLPRLHQQRAQFCRGRVSDATRYPAWAWGDPGC